MIGKTISHYKILEKLGEGGMGIVYKAQDTKLDRLVALKFLPRQFSVNEEEKARFVHEAKASAALEHPNICNIHEINETEGGQLFIIMAYYEGETLKEKIEKGPLKLDEAIDIAIQVAEGLNKAHKQDVIHRDIKSANIIITADGVAKILDFGLAKLKGQTKLTKEGTTLGTVAYMSPEQAKGGEMDHRSDIWSLGAVIYEIVSGQLPFKGDYDQAIMYSIMNDNPEPVTAIRTGVPQELERIINKALSKDHGERYQHADDLIVDLKKVKKISLPDSFQGRKKTKPGASPGFSLKLIKISFLVIAALAVILASVLIFKTKNPPMLQKKMLVVLPFENLGQSDDEYFTAGMTEEITTRLSMVKNLGIISRYSAKQYKNSNKSTKEIGQELGVQYILKGTIRWARSATGSEKVRISPHLIQVADDTQIWADTYDQVINDIFQVQTNIAQKVVAQLNITLGESERKAVEETHTDNLEAYHAFLRGRHLASQPHFTVNNWMQVIRNYQRAVDLDPKFDLAWAELARAHARLVFLHTDISKERQEKARKAAQRAMKLSPKSPKVRLSLSYYYMWNARDPQKAMKELDIAEEGLANTIDVLNAKAAIYELQGRFQDLITVIKKAYKLNPLSASIPINLAQAYWFTRQYPEAIEFSNQARALAPDNIWPYLYKAFNLWSWQGAVKEARKTIEEVPPTRSWNPYFWFWQEIGERKFQQAMERLSSNDLKWIKNKIFSIPKSQGYAYLYEFLEQPQKAKKYYLEAQKILEDEIKKTPNDPRLHSALGITLASLGEKERAIKEGKRGMQILPIAKDAVYGGTYVIDLALIYTIIGDYPSALDQLEYILSIPSPVSPGWLSLDPRWKRLQKLPRYHKILQEYNNKFKSEK